MAGQHGTDGRTREHVTAEIASRLAGEYVAEMTGRDSEAIVSLERAEDGDWEVDVEIVETPRIPDSTDILAVYRTRLNAEGDLLACKRVRRYARCRTGEA